MEISNKHFYKYVQSKQTLAIDTFDKNIWAAVFSYER